MTRHIAIPPIMQIINKQKTQRSHGIMGIITRVLHLLTGISFVLMMRTAAASQASNSHAVIRCWKLAEGDIW
jgi:hypothetical protein